MSGRPAASGTPFHAPAATSALLWQHETQNSNSAQHLDAWRGRGGRGGRRVSACEGRQTPAAHSVPRRRWRTLPAAWRSSPCRRCPSTRTRGRRRQPQTACPAPCSCTCAARSGASGARSAAAGDKQSAPPRRQRVVVGCRAAAAAERAAEAAAEELCRRAASAAQQQPAGRGDAHALAPTTPRRRVPHPRRGGRTQTFTKGGGEGRRDCGRPRPVPVALARAAPQPVWLRAVGQCCSRPCRTLRCSAVVR